MRRSSIRACLVSAFAVLALLLAACGVETSNADSKADPSGGGGTEEAGPAETPPEKPDGPDIETPENFEGTGGALFLNQAAEATSEVRTQKFEISMSMDGGPMPVAMDMTGAIDIENDLLQIEMDLGASMGDVMDPDDLEGFDPGMLDMTMIVADGQLYMRSPMMTMFTGSDAEWISMPADDMEADELGGHQDPTAFLDFLRSTEAEVTEVGEEDVRGVSTTHYSTVLDVRAILDEADVEDRDGMEEALDSFGGGLNELPMDVWIDGDGMVRRMEMTMDLSEVDDSADLGSMVMTIELFDFDEPVDIEVPDPSNVVDMEDLEGAEMFDF